MNVKNIVKRMKKTANLCAALLSTEQISKFATGERVSMSDAISENRLLLVHQEGLLFVTLFSKSLLHKRLREIIQEAKWWLKRKIKRSWKWQVSYCQCIIASQSTGHKFRDII